MVKYFRKFFLKKFFEIFFDTPPRKKHILTFASRLGKGYLPVEISRAREKSEVSLIARKTRKLILRDAIKSNLIAQLEKNHTTGQYYIDLVDDYMEMWDAKNSLTADIKERGTKILFTTASGSNVKTNDSVGDLLKTNAQMLKLLDSMGIKPVPEDDIDDDEM